MSNLNTSLLIDRVAMNNHISSANLPSDVMIKKVNTERIFCKMKRNGNENTSTITSKKTQLSGLRMVPKPIWEQKLITNGQETNHWTPV